MALNESDNNTRNLSKDLHIVVVTTSVLSVVCCFLVFASYLRYSRLRLHPSQLLFYRTLMDFVQAVVGIAVSVSLLRGHPLSCHGCVVPSLIYQAAIFGSGCWYLIMAVDLYLAIRNPFSCHEDYTWYYHLAVWSTTAVTVTVIGTAGQYGPDTYDVCWIRDHNCQEGKGTDPTEATTFAPHKFLELAIGIYFGPYLIAYVVTLVILAFARVALRKGMPNSDEVRKRVLQHSFVYVVCYSLQWTIFAGLWLAQIIVFLRNASQGSSARRYDLAISAAAVFGLNGVLDFAVWMWSGQSVVQFTNRRRTPALPDQPEDQLTLPLISDPGIVARQEVSAALRRDAMVCTSWAILDSVNVGQPAMEHARRDSLGAHNNLTPDFRKIVKKWIFPPDGRHEFEFKDFAPETFAQLRGSQSIEADSYSTAFRNITKHDSEQELLEKFSDGKSGSFFYFSLDSRFIVKTVTLSELNFLRSILCHYYNYITANPDSLLTRIYGLHRIRLAPYQKYLSMAVMGNILPRSSSCVVHEKYDLKGSSVGRRVLKRGEDRSSLDLSKKTLKDCDLVRKLIIGEENKQRLIEQLRRDADFLASIGVMDYSLLLGIHFCNQDDSDTGHTLGRSPSECPVAPQLQTDSGVTLSSGAESENSLDTGKATSVSISMEQEYKEKFRPAHLKKGRRHSSTARPAARRSRSNRSTSSYLLAPGEGYVPWFRRDLGGLKGYDSCHPDRRCIYFMGIIDILQRYDWSKKTERFLKTKLLCKDGDNISAINVFRYSQRFIQRIGGHFE